MKVVFDRSFSKALDKIQDKKLLKRIESTILTCEKSDNIKDLRNLKKLSGFTTFYRIKIADYRIGIELEKPDVLRFITVLHRKDIYKKFP